MAHITVDGRIYDLDKLSDPARQQAMNIDVVDQEIRRLQVQLMIYQTARNAYATALQQALSKEQICRPAAGGSFSSASPQTFKAISFSGISLGRTDKPIKLAANSLDEEQKAIFAVLPPINRARPLHIRPY
jgi:hypothetical protein